MSKEIVNRLTGEVLTVELELGERLWVSSPMGEVVPAMRAHFPLERWRFVGTSASIDDIPVRSPAQHQVREPAPTTPT